MASGLADIEEWDERAKASGYRVARLADMLGWSSRQIERHFRERFGATPAVQMRCWRMEQARRLLCLGWKVTAVAAAVGYRHVSNFTAAFKKSQGFCPHVLVMREVPSKSDSLVPPLQRGPLTRPPNVANS